MVQRRAPARVRKPRPFIGRIGNAAVGSGGQRRVGFFAPATGYTPTSPQYWTQAAGTYYAYLGPLAVSTTNVNTATLATTMSLGSNTWLDLVWFNAEVSGGTNPSFYLKDNGNTAPLDGALFWASTGLVYGYADLYGYGATVTLSATNDNTTAYIRAEMGPLIPNTFITTGGLITYPTAYAYMVASRLV